MQAHFEQWADVEPGDGDHGFGYRLPDRATIEWLSIPRATMEAAVEASIDADDIELRKYWSRNKARFGETGENGGVPEAVRTAFVRAEVDDMRPAISRGAADALRTPRRGFETSENFLVLPDDWEARRMPLEDLRLQHSETFGLPLEGDEALPQAGQSGDLMDLTELASIDGLGRAGTGSFGASATGGRRRPLRDLLSRAREFGGTGDVPVQQGVAGPVLDDSSDGLWIFRITDTDPARPPASLDEVRDRIAIDLQRLADWNRLQSEMDAIEAVARDNGLDTLAETHETTVRGPSNFRRSVHPSLPSTPQVSGLGQDQSVVDAIIDHSMTLSSEPLAETDRVDRVVLIPSDRHMAMVIAELDRRRPLLEAQYEQLLDQGALANRIISDEFGGLGASKLAEAFSGDALRARNNFKTAGGGEDEDGLEQVADADSASGDAR